MADDDHYFKKIPDRTMAALKRYVEHRIQPGHFLTAVLENNLMESLGRADEDNRAAIFEICMYIYNEIPGLCHGSPERVRNWLEPEREGSRDRG